MQNCFRYNSFIPYEIVAVLVRYASAEGSSHRVEVRLESRIVSASEIEMIHSRNRDLLLDSREQVHVSLLLSLRTEHVIGAPHETPGDRYLSEVG